MLYDIGRDPHELVNLAHPRYRHQYRALILELNALLNETIARETATGTDARLDESEVAIPPWARAARGAVKLPWLSIATSK